MSAVQQIPKSWQWTNMGAISTVVGGGTPSTQDASHFGGDVPWLTPADLSGFQGKYISSGERSLTQKGLEKSSAKLVPAGSILFTSRAPVGYVAIAETAVSTNQGFKNFVLEPDIAPSYCYYYLLSAKAHIQGMASGTTFLELPAREAKKIPIPIAPKQEQLRIAATLDQVYSDLDAGVAALQRCQEKLGRYRASVLKAAVEGELTAAWREQHPDVEPASELLQRILAERRRRWEQEQLHAYAEKGKAPPKNWKAKYKEPVAPAMAGLPTIPPHWQWVGVDQIGAIQGGLQKSPARKPVRNHFPYLRVANVHRGKLLLDDLHRFELTPPELRKLRLETGDVLLVEGNGSRTEIGRCAVWNGEVEDCVHQNHIIRIRLGEGVLPQYIGIFLNSPIGQIAMQQAASSTSGLYTLSVSKVRRLPIALPPTAEQEAIVDRVEGNVSRVDEIGAVVVGQLAHAARLRQSVLNRAFTGKLVPQDPTDEPAAALLERIAGERKARARSRPANARRRAA